MVKGTKSNSDVEMGDNLDRIGSDCHFWQINQFGDFIDSLCGWLADLIAFFVVGFVTVAYPYSLAVGLLFHLFYPISDF